MPNFLELSFLNGKRTWILPASHGYCEDWMSHTSDNLAQNSIYWMNEWMITIFYLGRHQLWFSTCKFILGATHLLTSCGKILSLSAIEYHRVLVQKVRQRKLIISHQTEKIKFEWKQSYCFWQHDFQFYL
jgi:hypothetical protein